MLALSGNATGFRPTGVVWLKTFQRDFGGGKQASLVRSRGGIPHSLAGPGDLKTLHRQLPLPHPLLPSSPPSSGNRDDPAGVDNLSAVDLLPRQTITDSMPLPRTASLYIVTAGYRAPSATWDPWACLPLGGMRGGRT